MKRCYSRALGIDLDILDLDVVPAEPAVEEAVSTCASPAAALTAAPCEYLLIEGLFLQGCKWNVQERELEQHVGMEVFTKCPLLCFVEAGKVEPRIETSSEQGLVLETKLSLTSLPGELEALIEESKNASLITSSRSVIQQRHELVAARVTHERQKLESVRMERKAAAQKQSAAVVRKHVYKCPVYMLPLRCANIAAVGSNSWSRPRTALLRISLPSTLEPKHWIRQGAAALSQLDA